MPIKIKRPIPRPVPAPPKAAPPDQPPALLKFLIHEKTEKYRLPRPHGRVHASDLDPQREWCPREPAVLSWFDKKRPKEFVSVAMQITFSQGYGAADTLMRFIPRDRLWGCWKCRSCGHEMLHRYAGEKCDGCDGSWRAVKYQEVFLQDPETKQVGSVDVMVDLRGDYTKTLVEVKSEGKDSFEKRNAPDFDHLWRTRLYLYLADRTPWLKQHGIDTQSARIIYVCKNGHIDCPELRAAKIPGGSRTPFKEYVVTRNDTVLTSALSRLKEWRTWKEAVETGAALPWPEGVCESAGCTRAKRCAARQWCFNRHGKATGSPLGAA